jgi:hypothetical protein
MITSEEKQFIDDNLVNYYHLVDYNSHFFGEPFLSNKYLYYFDGLVATIVPPRLGADMDQKTIDDLIGSIIKLHAPENIIFWGETPVLDFKDQAGYKLNKRNINLYKRELVFKTSDFLSSKKYRHYLNKAKEENLWLKFVKSPYYKSEYMDLLAKTHDKMLDVKSMSYYSIHALAGKTMFVEVLKDEKLVSVNIIIENMPNYVCFAEVGYDESFNRGSGISKAMLIGHYLGKTNYISWGGCASEGIFNYKKEILGDTPICFYDNFIFYTYYKKEILDWWLLRMLKTTIKE